MKLCTALNLKVSRIMKGRGGGNKLRVDGSATLRYLIKLETSLLGCWREENGKMKD